MNPWVGTASGRVWSPDGRLSIGLPAWFGDLDDLFADVRALEQAEERVGSVLEALDDRLSIVDVGARDLPVEAFVRPFEAGDVIEHQKALDAGARGDELWKLARPGRHPLLVVE